MQMLISLCFLGITISQASGQDNSTQMIYFKLTIDYNGTVSRLNYITDSINRLAFSDNSWIITKSTVTTSCVNVTCTCMPYYSWSDSVCQSMHCCGNASCSLSPNKTHACISDTAVTIMGFISLPSENYKDCLAPHSQQNYLTCNINLTNELIAVYSTLSGFDFLNIMGYSVGSVIANFQVIFASNVSSQKLKQKSEALASNLLATLSLVTSGVVQIQMPQNPVPYQKQEVVTCTSQEDLGTNPTWQLQQQNAINIITNGTQATVTSVSMNSTVILMNITELWEGNYSCAYLITSNNTQITHKASAAMDVCLKTSIDISTDPQFPLCTTGNSLLTVTIYCKAALTNENYTVLFTSQGITAAISQQPYTYGQSIYSATTIVDCSSSENQNVTCTFTNRCNQSTSATASINIIYYKTQYCIADGQWPNTKATFYAVLPCTPAVGQKLRTCSSSAVWDIPESYCVYQNLYITLQNSQRVNIGLGITDINAALVFSQLNSATNDSTLINTFSNINTSVVILSNLQTSINSIYNASAVNDFLTSSSNLLDVSLLNSWTNNNSSSNESKLAEQYLSSVENLIKMADLSSADQNKNLQVTTCNSTGCNNIVFNVSVTLQGTNGSVLKTAGFQQLQNYLPSNDNMSINSIVVSTTTEDQLPDSFAVTIDFELLRPRARNVLLKCVSWDNYSNIWSPEGCTWQGATNPSRCVCSHLTSFAILMSKVPVELPGMTEITYTGLSVSVLSLLIGLVIEITVWSAVVKTNTLYLRHTAHFHISLCLLIADCCFLASSSSDIGQIWCQTSAVLKHFCYLAMFFWMLCLSTTLLHQAVFLFHSVSKKNYLRFSLFLGYICPFLIVFITFLTNGAGAEGSYYSQDSCWLVYIGVLEGSIFTFIIPVGIIIFINVFSMLVVIMKLLDRPKTTDKSHDKDKNAAKTVLRTVILLTPIFGITWSLGFAVMIIDLTDGLVAYIVNYAFTVLNAFQGFLIFLTACIGDKMVRETVLSRFSKNAVTSVSESTTKLDSSWKK